ERLRHLLAAELEHPVVRPDARELVSGSARLRELVLVMRKHEVESASVDLEHRSEGFLSHHRALDMPAGPAAAPARIPRKVLARLVRLPECEVTGVLFEWIRLLLLDLVRTLAGKAAVLGVAGDAE